MNDLVFVSHGEPKFPTLELSSCATETLGVGKVTVTGHWASVLHG